MYLKHLHMEETLLLSTKHVHIRECECKCQKKKKMLWKGACKNGSSCHSREGE